MTEKKDKKEKVEPVKKKEDVPEVGTKSAEGENPGPEGPDIK